MYDREAIIKANIAVHTAAIDSYGKEPHYRQESRARVREILASLHARTQGQAMLDVCCGMGFMIDIGRELFPVIRGVDVTPAMLERIDCAASGCDIQVFLAQAESLPFPDNAFDVCTAYAALHHLHDVNPVLAEVYRKLKPGGFFYADLDPNAAFWKAIKGLDPAGDHAPAVAREINALRTKDQEIARNFNLDVDTVQLAEHWMHLDGGFWPHQLEDACKKAGFAEVTVIRHWFVGEAEFLHNPRLQGCCGTLREYLQGLGPLGEHLFKYLGIIARKAEA